MPADKGVRLDDRQRIANFREQPIETNEYHSVDGAEGEFLWSSSPQNVDLLPQRPNLCLKHYPRPDQIDNHPTNEPAKIPHCARSSSDSRSTAKQDKVCDRDRKYKLTNDAALVLLGRTVNGADTDNTLYHKAEGPGLKSVAEGLRPLGYK